MNYPLSPLSAGWPPALVSFRDAEGDVRLLVASWVGVACSLPAVATIAFPCGLGPEAVPLAGLPFVIHLVEGDWPGARQLPVLLDGGAGTFRPPVAWSLGSGAKTGAPLLADCPLVIECGPGRPSSRFGQCLLEGEVVTARVEGVVYGLDEPLDLCRLQPLLRRRPLRDGYLASPDGAQVNPVVTSNGAH